MVIEGSAERNFGLELTRAAVSKHRVDPDMSL